MDKTLAGLFGAASALALVGSTQAANVPAKPSGSLRLAQSHAELLAPIPNAAVWPTIELRDSGATADEGSVQLAEYYEHRRRHHHHHDHHDHYY